MCRVCICPLLDRHAAAATLPRRPKVWGRCGLDISSVSSRDIEFNKCQWKSDSTQQWRFVRCILLMIHRRHSTNHSTQQAASSPCAARPSSSNSRPTSPSSASSLASVGCSSSRLTNTPARPTFPRTPSYRVKCTPTSAAASTMSSVRFDRKCTICRSRMRRGGWQGWRM